MPQVFYRKYRPKSFEEVHGQAHIVTTLQNQLESGEVAHAYLFAGPRGTGKTTVARILASELGANEIDLVEIDAASNRGIDDIRNLREMVHFQPAQSPKKLYILDEAHMLTSEAFNALLKTLEEPPQHAHFVLCTTEPHRVPVTILSRCQRHNFLLGNKQSVVSYLRKIVDLEGKEIEAEVLDFIAQKSGGSYRDAAGLLQQVIGGTGPSDNLTESVLKNLGFGLETEAKELRNLIAQKKFFEFLKQVNKLAEEGVNVTTLLDSLITQLREELLNRQAFSGLDPVIEVKDLVSLLKGLNRARLEIKVSPLPQLPIELAIFDWVNGEIGGEIVSSTGQEAVRETYVSSDLPWDLIMARVRDFNHSLEALLKAAEPHGIKDDTVLLRFKYRFHKERIEEIGNRRLIEEAIGEILGRKIKVRCQLVRSGKRGKGLGGQGRQAPAVQKTGINNGSEDHDILRIAQEIFGGEIIE